jgi:integrase
MPATQRGQAYRLGPNRWGLRYRDADGIRRRQSPFPSKSAALTWFRDIIEPQLRGEAAPVPNVTLSEFVPLYLERHGPTVRPRTLTTLTVRLGPAQRTFGTVPLRDLVRMASEIAAWRAQQPERTRYAYMSALRQCLDAAVGWGYMDLNPAKLAGPNRQPSPRAIRAFTRAELDAIAAELHPRYAPLPAFAAATGLRPEEWIALERRDADRQAGTLHVRRTVSAGEVVELGKTARSRRQVPLTKRALAALDAISPRLDTPLIFSAPSGGPIHLDNFRGREWVPAIEASGPRWLMPRRGVV